MGEDLWIDGLFHDGKICKTKEARKEGDLYMAMAVGEKMKKVKKMRKKEKLMKWDAKEVEHRSYSPLLKKHTVINTDSMV